MKSILTFLFTLFVSLAISQPNVKSLDEYIAKAQKDWQIPGMAVAIVKDGEVVLSKGYGQLSVTDPTPVDEHTLFAIASNTKAFTASAMAKLVDENQISWDDKVTSHLPYFKMYDPWVTAEITVEDLLCHRAGHGTYSGDLMWYKTDLSTEDVIRKIQFVPQAYGFRNGYGYSNLMFITAGEIIRKVTDKPWYQYVKESFFDPLKMTRTTTSTDDLSVLGNYVMPHKPLTSGQEVIPWVNWDEMGAAGGIISSVDDMSRWMIMNLDRGMFLGDTLLPTLQQNKLWTMHNNFAISEANRQNLPGRHFEGYGLGWRLTDYHGNLLAQHSGGYDGMYSRVMLVPDQKLGIVLLTNTMKGITSPLGMYIVDRYLELPDRDWSEERLQRSRSNISQIERIEEREKKRKKKLAPAKALAEYAGTYESGMHGRVMITKSGDQLRMKFENAKTLGATLTHWHGEVWQINWDETHAWFDFGTVQFLLSNNLTVEGLQFDVPNDDIFFDEVNLKKIE